MMPSGLPDDILDGEPLAVFLTSSSSHFNSTGVKAAAFMPSTKTGEKSVCRHDTTPADRLQQLAQLYFKDCPQVRVHGAGVVNEQVVRAADLTIHPDEPPDRHANIRGWSSSEADPKMSKALNMERAKQIAEQAILVTW